MIGIEFGEKIAREKQEQALLFPDSPLEPGHAGVTVEQYKKPGFDHVERVLDERISITGLVSKTVYIPAEYSTQIHVVNENHDTLLSKTLEGIEGHRERGRRKRTLREIRKALGQVASYGTVAGVPFDAEKTHKPSQGGQHVRRTIEW